MDIIDEDIESLKNELGFRNSTVKFPHTVLGQDGHTKEFNRDYFSQLTKNQVWKLFNIYRIDHELFGYSVQAFLNVAQ